MTRPTPSGTPRLFSEGRFYTPSGKARFITTRNWQPANLVEEAFPLVLNTGRIRDQWHTMTRTGKAARLGQHIAEPYIEMHPLDAKRLGVIDRQLVEVSSRWGKAIVRASLSDAQQTGSVFIPIHWSDQVSAMACVDTLVNPDTDPVSGQPEFKHTPVRVSALQTAWYGFVLSREPINTARFDYWTVIKEQEMWRYEVAAREFPHSWSLLKRDLCSRIDQAEWIEFSDAAQNRYRAACLQNGRLQCCIFTDATAEVMERDWLAQLFHEQSLGRLQRNALLAGSMPGALPDHGPVICSCFSVGLRTIQSAIRSQGLVSVEEVGKVIRAGTNCGSCKPEISRLIQEMSTPSMS